MKNNRLRQVISAIMLLTIASASGFTTSCKTVGQVAPMSKELDRRAGMPVGSRLSETKADGLTEVSQGLIYEGGNCPPGVCRPTGNTTAYVTTRRMAPVEGAARLMEGGGSLAGGIGSFRVPNITQNNNQRQSQSQRQRQNQNQNQNQRGSGGGGGSGRPHF